MAVPKRRKSKSKTRTVRANQGRSAHQLQYCKKCGQATPSHTVCPTCGYYMGRVLVGSEDD